MFPYSIVTICVCVCGDICVSAQSFYMHTCLYMFINNEYKGREGRRNKRREGG